MSVDKPPVNADYLKRQRRIDDLESSTNERIRIIATTFDDDSSGSEDAYLGGGKQPSGHKMATEGELRAAEIAAAEARTDTKIVRLEGKLDLVINKIDTADRNAADNRRAIIANGWVIFGAMIVFIGIIVTIAPLILDFGFKLRETITKEIHDQSQAVPTPIKPPQ